MHFENNAADSIAPDMLVDDTDLLDMALLFARDNVDHNILTLDDKGTFHRMGMIAALTPGQKKDHVIPRRTLPIFFFQSKAQFLSLNIAYLNM